MHWWLFLISLFTGPSTLSPATAPTAAPQPPAWSFPFRLGETIHYTAKLGFFDAGSATTTVAGTATDHGDSVLVFTLEASGGPPAFRANYNLTSWTRIRDFASRRFVRTTGIGPRTSTESYDILPDSARYRMPGNPTSWVAPAHPLDELAFLYYLRTLPLASGDVRYLRGYFKNGFNPIVVRPSGSDVVTLGDGTRVACLPVSVSSRDVEADACFTTDARRVPVLVHVPLPFGRVTLVADALPRN